MEGELEQRVAVSHAGGAACGGTGGRIRSTSATCGGENIVSILETEFQCLCVEGELRQHPLATELFIISEIACIIY